MTGPTDRGVHRRQLMQDRKAATVRDSSSGHRVEVGLTPTHASTLNATDRQS